MSDDPNPTKNLQDLMRTLRESQVKLEAGIDKLPVLLAAGLEKLAELQLKSRSEIMDRIDRLQETVELVREDARVNWSTADVALNRGRNSREEIERLTGLITAMERRHQALAAIVDGLRNPDKT